MDRKTEHKKLKLIKATFHAPTANRFSMLELEFSDGRKAFLSNEIKRTILDAGAVWLGFEDLPPITIQQDGQRIELKESTKNAAVIQSVHLYREYLDGDSHFSDGQILFSS
jgi:hypothetical protein